VRWPAADPQRRGEREVGHVVERERALQTFGGDLPPAEERAGVVHQDVETAYRLLKLGRHPARVGNQLEVGVDGIGADLAFDRVSFAGSRPATTTFAPSAPARGR